jgi:hypothetical protein
LSPKQFNELSLAFFQVVKLARKYDPDGIRTLGVGTKCDDAANAEASDVVEKACAPWELGMPQKQEYQSTREIDGINGSMIKHPY